VGEIVRGEGSRGEAGGDCGERNIKTWNMKRGARG
jgi:hypothetical protein